MVLVQRNTLWPLIVQDLEDVVVVGLEMFSADRAHSLDWSSVRAQNHKNGR